ncbi:MAG: efflux RND transporter periplasmic adaptor subunit, partial [Bacteroidota bacterium]
PSIGLISRLDVEIGERVVGTRQMEGTEMMRLANLDAMEVQVDVSEIDVLRVSLGDQAKIEVDAYIDREFTGIVTEIANSATNSTTASLTTDQVTNFIVKIRIDRTSYQDLINSKRQFAFRPGMSASVEINTQTVENVLSVPIQAVTTREEEDEKNKNKDAELKEVVFLMVGDTANMVEVKTGIQDDTYIQILSGLKEEDVAVIGPYSAVSKKLEQGIQIREEEDKKKKDDDEA